MSGPLCDRVGDVGTNLVAASVTLSSATLSFTSLGETQQLTATVRAQNGQTIAGATVTWASSASSVASVSASGTVTAVGNGTATITATSGSARGTAAVTVDAEVVLQPNQFCGDFSAAAIATFEDTTLAAAIRAELSVGAQAPLTCGLISGLTELYADDVAIASLVGVQNLTSLTVLDLSNNSISSLGALSELTSLTDSSSATTRSAISAR